MRGMNFIVIVSDTFRFDNLVCYEHIRPRFQTPLRPVMTPRLDRFAQSAAIFDNAYIGSFPTAPHRKDLLTRRNVFPWEGWSPLRPDAVTLAGLPGDAGYETIMIQDTPHTIQRAFHFERDSQGWDFIRGQESDRLASWHSDQPIDPRLVRGEHNWKQHLANIAEIRRCEQDCFVAQTMTRATRWLERWRERGSGPFLLYVDTFDPHEPWDPGEEFVALYPKPDIGWRTYYPPGGKQEDTGLTDEEMEAVRATYAARVTQTDHYLGRLLDCARAKGLMENTLVIFTTDHGTHLGKGKWGHGILRKNRPWPFEELAHTPLLIHHPEGHGVGQRFKTFIQPFDLTATMLDFAGLEIPGNMDGRSLLGVLSGT